MIIEEFLDKVIEGYLFSDLESMSKIKLPPSKDEGAVGYPMMVTMMAGMELLGNLLLNSTDGFRKKPRDDDSYFYNFWNNFLANKFPVYSGLGELVRNLVRHGLAHTFLTKQGILITKFPEHKPFYDKTNKTLVINCNVLYEDFKIVYFDLVKPINKTTMQVRLDNMVAEYNSNSEKFFASLSGTSPDLTNLPKNYASLSALASCASLSAQQSVAASGMGLYTSPNTFNKS